MINYEVFSWKEAGVSGRALEKPLPVSWLSQKSCYHTRRHMLYCAPRTHFPSFPPWTLSDLWCVFWSPEGLTRHDACDSGAPCTGHYTSIEGLKLKTENPHTSIIMTMTLWGPGESSSSLCPVAMRGGALKCRVSVSLETRERTWTGAYSQIQCCR